MRNRIHHTAQWSLVLVTLLGFAANAVAHHAYSAFDMTAQKSVTGTVKKLDWTNPHTWIWVDVANEAGVVETWGIEGMSPNYLARRGWSRNSVKPGEKISITFHPMKDGGKGGSFLSAKHSDGTPIVMGGAITDP